MDIQRIAAFSAGATGGNPAGVVIEAALPAPATMQRVAAELGYSETAFAAPDGEGWRVRYFSPETEVPFCGHATIALGAALALRHGDGAFDLRLNEAAITVEGRRDGPTLAATLCSPPTRSRPVAPELVREALALFGWSIAALDPRLPPARVHAGADHLLLALRERGTLCSMYYDLASGRALMREAGLVTIILAHAVTPRRFRMRNPFASGGVYEDPATGAAAAALAGYLRDLGWPHEGAIEIQQGDEMGMPSRLRAEIPPEVGAPVRVSGTARVLAG
ncbi:PhzF family phenazine biosynthesis protein [Roseomonas sp. OT10]|uniref:PhzF family phenazine biosynthesis protein n=1 Tax=Roseomonas cutis TaxID=2897332 RepID=UPI001E63DE54|nr:PhzF family phenazine biosynthesis protein [Roseomonas sp. OT10]UFN49907.1 PhzF family phenazine biosynthesis protein [Roseomonas sp. OT10]